jgi:uncharacterized membrane protein
MSNVKPRKEPLVEFHSFPPDPAEFPRLRLLWPPAIPLLLLAILWLGERGGHQWNIHGASALLVFALVLSLIVGLVASLLALLSLVPALRKHQSLRTPMNLACTMISAVFLVVCVLYLGIGFAKIVAS